MEHVRSTTCFNTMYTGMIFVCEHNSGRDEGVDTLNHLLPSL